MAKKIKKVSKKSNKLSTMKKKAGAKPKPKHQLKAKIKPKAKSPKKAKKIVKKAAPAKKKAAVPAKKIDAKKFKKAVKKSVKPIKMKESKKVKKIIQSIDNEPTYSRSTKKATTLLGALEFSPYEPKQDESYMGDQQRNHFRKILDAWKQQLMQDVDLTVGHLKEEAVFYADPVDRAAQEEGFNLELRTRDRERRLIKKIEQSLDLLNTGEYGFCEDCGAEIGIRRLEARPTAVKCIDCKTFQEIREKQLGG